MKLTMTKRDKMLLAVISLVAIVFAFYYFVYQPTIEHVQRQREYKLDLQMELNVSKTYEASIATAVAAQEESLAGMTAVIDSYYPYLPPQYYVDLLREFADEQGLTVDTIDAVPPSLQELDKILSEDDVINDPLYNAIIRYNELHGTVEQETGNGGPAVSPGAIIVNRLSFSLKGGELGAYLSFLDSVNKTGYPIYVDNYALVVRGETLEMSIDIVVLSIDRLTQEQHDADAAGFTFPVLSPAGELDIFKFEAEPEEQGQQDEPEEEVVEEETAE